MLKKIFCILLLCYLCINLSGCTANKPKDNLQEIKNRGKIIVGVRSDTRPFGYRDIEGNLQGFDIDLAKAISKHIFADMESVELVPVTASNRISMLNSKKVDMLIATMSITDQRRLVVDFSVPYYMAGQAIMVRNKTDISSIKQLNGKRIIIVYGSTGESSVRMNAPEAIVRGYKDYNLAFQALKNGEADAMIADDTVLYNLSLNDKSVKILDKRFSKEPYAVAFRKGKESEKLQESVNFTINLMQHSGMLRKLQAKWGIKQ